MFWLADSTWFLWLYKHAIVNYTLVVFLERGRLFKKETFGGGGLNCYVQYAAGHIVKHGAIL